VQVFPLLQEFLPSVGLLFIREHCQNSGGCRSRLELSPYGNSLDCIFRIVKLVFIGLRGFKRKRLATAFRLKRRAVLGKGKSTLREKRGTSSARDLERVVSPPSKVFFSRVLGAKYHQTPHYYPFALSRSFLSRCDVDGQAGSQYQGILQFASYEMEPGPDQVKPIGSPSTFT